MKNFIIKTLISAVAILAGAYLLSGVSIDENRFVTALLVALALSLLNFFVRPLLIFFTLPVTIITLGLFLFIINAIIILIADKLVDGFHVASIWWALLFSLVVSVCTYILETIIEPEYKKNK
jgi:putative membrane protein